jgi:hypothetical protein
MSSMRCNFHLADFTPQSHAGLSSAQPADTRSACSFADWELAASRDEDAAVLKQHLDRHWHGFLELQHLGNLLDADRATRAALDARQPPPSDKVAAVLGEAQQLPWLPAVAAQVQPCARMPLAPYVRDLLRQTVLAVVRAFSLDAASKADPTLAQARTRALRCRGVAASCIECLLLWLSSAWSCRLSLAFQSMCYSAATLFFVLVPCYACAASCNDHGHGLCCRRPDCG